MQFFHRVGTLLMWGNDDAEFDDAVTEDELRALAGNIEIKVLRCSVPVSDSVWVLVNTCFFSTRPDVELRICGHHGMECDLNVVRHLTKVRRFAADRLMRAKNVERIAEIPQLESLSVGINNLQDFRFLERVPRTLTELFLGATRSKTPSLMPLARISSLRKVYIEGQNKDIEVLAGLQAIEDLTLRSITTPNLSYLTPLKNLWSLDIKLGGIKSLGGIEQKENIKYLELWQIRNLQDIEIISVLPGLQNLFLQSLPHISSLPPLVHAKALRRVALENMKDLTDYKALERAPALEEVSLQGGSRQLPEQLLPILRNPGVRRVDAFFGSDRKNQHFARLREQYGKSSWDGWAAFEYR